MLYLINNNHNPYFNIALEEYLFSSNKYNEDIIIIWRNEESIFLGKNQNPYIEILHSLIKKRTVPLLRRISGGGTVYHDLGNINMTFIQKNIKLDEIDFIKHTQFMQKMLQYFGINATYSDRKDLLVEGKKVSGSAQCIRGNKCLYHGTLLFNANLDNLNKYLNTSKIAKSNATKSVKSKVVNLDSYLDMDIEEFINKIGEYITLNISNSKKIELGTEDIEIINEKAINIYSKDEWILGKTPKFNIYIENKEGLIIDANISNWKIKSFNIKKDNKYIELQKLIGEYFFEDNIMKIVHSEYKDYANMIKSIF